MEVRGFSEYPGMPRFWQILMYSMALRAIVFPSRRNLLSFGLSPGSPQIYLPAFLTACGILECKGALRACEKEVPTISMPSMQIFWLFKVCLMLLCMETEVRSFESSCALSITMLLIPFLEASCAICPTPPYKQRKSPAQYC